MLSSHAQLRSEVVPKLEDSKPKQLALFEHDGTVLAPEPRKNDSCQVAFLNGPSALFPSRGHEAFCSLRPPSAELRNCGIATLRRSAESPRYTTLTAPVCARVRAASLSAFFENRPCGVESAGGSRRLGRMDVAHEEPARGEAFEQGAQLGLGHPRRPRSTP